MSQYTVAANGTLTAKSPATVGGRHRAGRSRRERGREERLRHEFQLRHGVPVHDLRRRDAVTKTPPTVATGSFGHDIVLSADGKSAYVPDTSDNTVSQYNVAGNGTLSPKSPGTVTAGSGPFGIALSPSPPTITSVAPNSGTLSGGQTVTITGTNFTATASVKFGTGIATGSLSYPARRSSRQRRRTLPGPLTFTFKRPPGSARPSRLIGTRSPRTVPQPAPLGSQLCLPRIDAALVSPTALPFVRPLAAAAHQP